MAPRERGESVYFFQYFGYSKSVLKIPVPFSPLPDFLGVKSFSRKSVSATAREKPPSFINVNSYESRKRIFTTN